MSNQSGQSAPYTDTFILDCNRNNSVEADAGHNTNPAQFTNKQGKGLKLNRGDKVSLHSAMINEIGNTDGTIEFKGETIKNSSGDTITYQLEETSQTLSQPQPLDDLFSDNTNFPFTPSGAPVPSNVKHRRGEMVGMSTKQLLQPYGNHQSDCSSTTRTFEMKDNEMNVQCSYFKTTNGENYFHLPRRFDCGNSRAYGLKHNKDKDGNGEIAPTARISSGFQTDEDTLPWAYHGAQWSQCPATEFDGTNEIGYHDNAYNGMPLPDVRVQSQVPEDWFFQDKSRRPKCENMAVADDGQTPAVGQNMRNLNTLGTTQRFRYKNDNSRFMIFKKERTYFTTPKIMHEFLTPQQLAECVKPDKLTGSSTNDFLSYVDTDRGDGHAVKPVPADLTIRYWNVRDPACTSDWNPYYEIKNISVESGFKAPEDVAEEVSRKLNKTAELTEIYSRVGEKSDNPGYRNYNWDGSHGGGGEDPTRVNTGMAGAILDPTVQSSHQCVGIKKDGELFKSFYSTNHRHFNATNANKYFAQSGDGTTTNYPENLPEVVRYMSGYHYIGVKRPNLWITGRKFCRDALGVSSDVGSTWGEVAEKSLHPDAPAITTTANMHHEADIITTIPWSKRHLLNDFIKSQGEYPELFDYPYSAIKVRGSYKDGTLAGQNVAFDKFQMGNSKQGYTLARFLHIDMAKKNANHWKDNANKFKHDSRRLGCDNYLFAHLTDYDPAIPDTEGETPTGYKQNIESVVGRDPVNLPSAPNTYPDVADRVHRTGQLPYYDLSSSPLWFWHDHERQDIDGGGQDMDCDDFNLCYGCMKKYNPAKEGVADPTMDGDFIAFTTKRIGGIPDYMFHGCNQENATANQTLDSNNFIGVDRHFNAYGTNVIMPYSGYLTGTQPDLKISYEDPKPATGYNDNTQFYYSNQPGIQLPPNAWLPANVRCKLEYSYQHALHTYLGANQISLNYDSEGSKRFNWLNLHTPEFIGNNFNAGSDATDPKLEGSSDQVYKINKRLGGASFTPEMVPYNTDVSTTSLDDNKNPIEIATSNWNIQQWDAIFDAHSGITFHNFGGTLENKPHWSKSLWGLLGFSFEQFNYKYENDPFNIKDRVSFNTRINPGNQGKTPFQLTNALVKTSDVSVYRENIYGAGMFNDQGVSYGNTWHGGLLSQNGKKITLAPQREYHINNPAVSITTTSVPLLADAQPTKMLKPYYLIRSNIVGDMKYIGGGNSTDGGQTLPIIGVVNKENGFGDYYFQTSQMGSFTITDDVVISEIKTSIHDPDMTLARVDKNSAVLYLIEKQNNNNLNIVSTLMQDGQLIPEMLDPDMVPLTDAELQQYFSEGIINTAQEQVQEMEGNTAQHYQTTGGEPDENIGTFAQYDFGQFAPVAQQPQTQAQDDVPATPTNIGKRIRARVNPERELGGARYVGAPDPAPGRIYKTRAGTRKLEEFRGYQERARARLYQNFVRAGDAPSHQSSEVPPWYREVDRNQPGLARTLSFGSAETGASASGGASSEEPTPGTRPSAPMTAPSDPGAMTPGGRSFAGSAGSRPDFMKK